MFALLAGIPDYCSSTGCLVGQVPLGGSEKRGQKQQLVSNPIPPVPKQILASDRTRAGANGMPGGCPVFELSAYCIPSDTGALH
ncbi:hypothetical protein GUITHDRAFT_153037 [Guillardia theta CCMP2712]|uniref:Uncharacterized protein n=1 Tax=Guillardia theta (strain CCMP2712) TaxID=905079 RepID=L1J8K6_GUITC|nr:hypothetical protein GUITHDRAFT_153037 [Guillardia theta CCMP2712]EKX44395.1 hypothetical protein GUITHDRAFT_153037 [Guillardia theta CCMP2712]|eukprot:XP_005831375.1 hypothetical protein GUITHDRAFT_153037 [Guillardia theta CCMP2712]